MHVRELRSGGYRRDECGASTAEYAVGTVAATGFASLLYLIYPLVDAIIRACITAAMSSAALTRGPIW